MGWAIDGPVPTHVADGRRMLYTATSGAEGVGGIHDLKVVPLANPGQGIRVMTGTGLILSRYVSAQNESYQGAISSERVVSTSLTTSSGRSDLVVMQVEDPWADNSPWPEPEVGDLPNFDAFPIRVIEGVPNTATRLQDIPGYETRTAITLARIDFGPSTTTVDSDMIVDLRTVAQPRSKSEMRTYALVSGDSQTLTATTAYPSGGQTWPLAVEDAWGEIPIPPWATRARVFMMWVGVVFSGDIWGSVWVQIGPTVNPNNRKTQEIAWDTTAITNTHRTPVVAADDVWLPPELRGTRQKFYPRANVRGKTGSSPTARLDWGGAMVLQVEFYEQAV